jgi:hypothetical protein
VATAAPGRSRPAGESCDRGPQAQAGRAGHTYLPTYLLTYFLTLLPTNMHCTALHCTALRCTAAQYPVPLEAWPYSEEYAEQLRPASRLLHQVISPSPFPSPFPSPSPSPSLSPSSSPSLAPSPPGGQPDRQPLSGRLPELPCRGAAQQPVRRVRPPLDGC